MTNKDKTAIYFVVDRSGSMQSIKEETENGFKVFIDTQKEGPGECVVTLTQFDNEYEVVFRQKPLAEVPPLVLQPRGTTALFDAIGRTINEAGSQLSALPEDQRPASVVVAILTDGYNNSSREFSQEMVRSMITHQQNVYRWTFVYLGANQDSILVGAGLGIDRGSSLTYSGANVGVAMGAASMNVNSYRGAVARGATAGRATYNTHSSFSDDQRDVVKDDGQDDDKDKPVKKVAKRTVRSKS